MSEGPGFYEWKCTCASCGASKHHELISVITRDFDIGNGPYYAMSRNVVYCKDSDRCFVGAIKVMDNYTDSVKDSMLIAYPVRKEIHEYYDNKFPTRACSWG